MATIQHPEIANAGAVDYRVEDSAINPKFPAEVEATPANWVVNASILWGHRHTLARVAGIAVVVSLVIAFVIPKRYESTGRIMPPESAGAGAAVFAALAGHALGELGGLGSLAGSLLGSRNSSALFVDLLRSGTVSGHLIDRFQLQHAYHKRYRVDAAKYLARHTTIVDDKKSGVITVTVEDSNPRRARDLAQAYLEELNLLVTRTNTSSAHQERIFIEARLKSVQSDLERAQQEMSEFSSSHTTIDIKEQTRAMVDAAAKLQGELIVGQSELSSLEQIYGSGNVRVRAAQARVANLQRELAKMAGTGAPLPEDGSRSGDAAESAQNAELYPPLRQIPRLAVPYADLYRRVRVQETVYELLTQQYEVARIQEAKDVPVVSVIDTPGIPEKKSFPPRLLLAFLLTSFAVCATGAYLLFQHRWALVSAADPRKVLAREVIHTFQARMARSISHSEEAHRVD
jgi:capsule polysaccharide export protein KpsE/RkpR